MQAAEQALIDAGTSVDALMHTAGKGVADWVWRIAAGRPVTVLCGPGNNGGDGYVIAETLRAKGLAVTAVAPIAPATPAAKNARRQLKSAVASTGKGVSGAILVDCLFGSGLSRSLSAEHMLLLRDLASRHEFLIAVDMPSGVSSDDGKPLNDGLPQYQLTVALGAWKYAHWLMPSAAQMGARRLVDIGVNPVENTAQLVRQPQLGAPIASAHKYTRGLCAVVGGEMSGAAILSCEAAMHAGAGYVKLLSDLTSSARPADLVVSAEGFDDDRVSSFLVGPGLGRGAGAAARLATTLATAKPTVLDADALVLLRPDMLDAETSYIATPHAGELDRLCKNFAVVASGKINRARALAKSSGMVIIAKGPDTVIAAPDGRVAIAGPASSWLSVAGTGDVLAGIVAGRLATGACAWEASQQAIWLHSEAARDLSGPFTASELAGKVSAAYAACL